MILLASSSSNSYAEAHMFLVPFYTQWTNDFGIPFLQNTWGKSVSKTKPFLSNLILVGRMNVSSHSPEKILDSKSLSTKDDGSCQMTFMDFFCCCPLLTDGKLISLRMPHSSPNSKSSDQLVGLNYLEGWVSILGYSDPQSPNIHETCKRRMLEVYLWRSNNTIFLVT